MNVAAMRDHGALLTARFGYSGGHTAGATADGVEVDGAYIDTDGFDSLKVLISYTTTLTAAATLTVSANGQDATSSAGAGVADFGDAMTAAVEATGDSGGSTETGVVELDFDLTGANRYFRAQATLDLSAANTDTVDYHITYVLCGAEVPPATARNN